MSNLMKTHKYYALAIISLALCIRADEPPIRLVSPEDGSVFTAGEPIHLRAEPRGTQLGAIQKLEFVSRTVIGEATSAPYSFSWNSASPGIYSIFVRVTTMAGRVESWKSTIAVLPSVEGRALHVDSSSRTATADGSARAPYRSIQDAVDAALNGDTIKVAAGEYRGTVAIREKNLRLLGGYSADFTTRVPRSTRVLGEGADQVVEVDFNGSTEWGIIDGFSISGGKRGVYAHTFEDPAGKYFLLINNAITGNSNPDAGVAGVAINQVSAAVLGNTISSNTAPDYAGLSLNGNASTVGLVKSNLVEANISTVDYGHGAGIAIAGKSTTGSITRNVVKRNRAFYGAGIFVDGDSGTNFIRVSHNSVLRNIGFLGTGEFVDGGATAIVENEIIAWNETINNEPNNGGAFAIDSGPKTHVTMINCTVAHNASYYDEYTYGNGLLISEDANDSVTVHVKNCIFWRNAKAPGGKEINEPARGLLKIEFSNVDQSLKAAGQLQLGTGMLRADPLFADPQNDDFHLKSKSGRWNGQGLWVTDAVDSPCLDAGDPNSIFQNEPAPNGGRINLGAWGNTAEASRSGGGNGNALGLSFTNVRVLPGGFREISGAGPPGRYQLQVTGSLSLGQTVWTDLTVLTNTSGAVTYEDRAETVPLQRFYRARSMQ